MQHKSLIIFSFLIFLHLISPPYVVAQDSFKGNSGEPFTPSTIIIIIMAIIFMFTGCLAVFLRRFSDGCFGLNIIPAHPGLTADGELAVRGLDPAAIKAIPTYLYSDVKQHRKGQVELECAVCLNEFQDSDDLRLLPGCSHVFHPKCIDKWLVTHVTCPICRQYLEPETCVTKPPRASIINIPTTNDNDDQPGCCDSAGQSGGDINSRLVVKDYDSDGDVKKNIEGKFPRSHSTGHSMAGSERFTLVLPEEVQNNLPNRSKTLTSILSPRSAQRCGWFSVTPPIIGSRSGLVRSTVSPSSKILELTKVKTSDRLWPI